MSHSEWVRARGAGAPAALIARVEAVLASDGGSAGLPVAEALLRAGETLLGSVLEKAEAGRAVALDLLAADACVTWAFEAEAESPGTLPGRAATAMERIAGLAA